ncbi:hypothetical protein O6H91_04G015200 [Diphasiastrum complanatum]|uniref:Uncharacterized protein n=1 Tax=Diphasiastrum complanatum TaxID=34168 RepID=A0ACC2DUC7_DIPCM|nr:hypothetical protein O6H91_Y195800 [Diphasiastrum complanatum]KAJ7557909.1 hypothetical protein O6H91_04G015200 [Diphasiastrum complanatum]
MADPQTYDCLQGQQPYQFRMEWTHKQTEHLHNLQNALDRDASDEELYGLLDKIMEHYEVYHEAKEDAARHDILQVMYPMWQSLLESVFSWIGGWRPTTILRLVNSQASELQGAQPQLASHGWESAGQFCEQSAAIHALQRKTEREEDQLSQQFSVLQQTITAEPVLVQALKLQLPERPGHTEEFYKQLEAAFEVRLKELEILYLGAERLRQVSFKTLINILNPVQAARYLISVAQYEFAMKKIGDNKIRMFRT